MKLRLCPVTAAILASLTPFFLLAQQKSDAGSKVLALEAKWNDAYKRGDFAALNSLLADEFMITIEDGRTFSKAGYIAQMGAGTSVVEVSEMSEFKVRMHGNTAVVAGAYHEKGRSNGKPYDYHDRFTDVWVILMANGS